MARTNEDVVEVFLAGDQWYNHVQDLGNGEILHVSQGYSTMTRAVENADRLFGGRFEIRIMSSIPPHFSVYRFKDDVRP